MFEDKAMPKVLTEDQVRLYKEEGAIWPIPLLSPAEVADCRRRFEAIEEEIGTMNGVDTTSDPVRAEALAAAVEEKEAQESALEKIGMTNRDHELTLGVNLFIIGTSLRWQNDISWLKHDLLSDTRNDIRFRSQVTLAF